MLFFSRLTFGALSGERCLNAQRRFVPPPPSLFIYIYICLIFYSPFLLLRKPTIHTLFSPTHFHCNTEKIAIMKFSALTLAPLLALPLAQATITPTSPDGSTTVKVGDTIEALWTADSTDGWTDVEIQLMTGDNLAVRL